MIVVRRARCVVVVVSLLLITGCATGGLSPREVRGQDFSTYVMALYEPASPGAARPAAAPPQPLRLPARVAVAQVGEVAPPLAVLEVLRKDPGTFAAAHPIPGATAFHGEAPYHAYAADREAAMRRAAQQHVERMRRYAQDVGADYLFLYGGTIDHATTGTPLGAADLTIVGGWLVPSKRIAGVARASGALIDVQSGRVVASVSADAQRRRLAPSFARDSAEVQLLKSLRDEVVVELARQLAARMKADAALAGSFR